MKDNWSEMNSITGGESEQNEEVLQVSLTLRAVDGREASLQVPYTIDISSLKKLVALEFNDTVDRVRLIYRGKRLNPEESLSNYIAKKDANELHCIHVVFRSNPTNQDESPSTAEEQDGSSSTTAAINNASTRTHGASAVHNLPGTLSLDTLRLGPSAQLSFTTSSSLPGLSHTDLMSGQAILQSLISSLGQATSGTSTVEFNSVPTRRQATAAAGVQSSDDTVATAQSQATTEYSQGTLHAEDIETSNHLRRTSARGASQTVSSPTETLTSGLTNTVLRDTGESGSTGARGVDSHNSRPQQLRVTVGSLPVSLGSGGLGQLFQTVLGQLASPGALQRQTTSRSRRMSSRQRAASLFPDYPVRNGQSTTTDASETDTRGNTDSRSNMDTSLPPGLTAFLRRTVSILGQSRRGVTRASESILETLEDVLTQTSRRGSGRHNPSGIVSLPQRETSGQGPESVWVSNECISEELAWDALTQLAHVIRRATGWEFPDSTQDNGTNTTSLSLAHFLLSFQQLSSLCSSVLSQVEAWQRGTGRLRVADIGHSIEMLALSSAIQANLASLFSWLFLHLSRHVDPTMLYERMHWDFLSNDRSLTRHSNDEDGFAEPHESTVHEQASTNAMQSSSSEASGAPVTEIASESSPLACTTYRKRSIDEEATEAVVPSVETHLEDVSTVKKQRTTHACEDLNEGKNLSESSQSSQNASLSRMEAVLSTCPKTLQDRFRKWVANPEMFSRAVLAQARVRPASDAYSSNHLVVAQANHGLVAKPLFKLCWDQTASRCNLPSEYEVPEHLSNSYIALLLEEFVEQAQSNPDFQEEPHRFPYIEKAARLLASIRRS